MSSSNYTNPKSRRQGEEMKVLDLFAGLKGWSDPFKARGHEVYTIDKDPKFDVDSYQNIFELHRGHMPWIPDIILASPPCEGFSVMQIGKNWTKEHEPKTGKAIEALDLVSVTRQLITEFNPKFWIIENPRAKLRKLPIMAGLERRTVTYCQYGEKRMKPTDLWGGFPPSLVLKPICKNGDSCHVSAPRGSRTGTQGMDRDLSAKIPEQLALAICCAAEIDMNKAREG